MKEALCATRSLCRRLGFCGILVAIPFGSVPSGRDIDPGIATRRRFCITQTRRSPEILGIFQGNERHVLRVVRTRLGAPSRNLVVISSPPKATGEYKMREQALLFHVCETVSAVICAEDSDESWECL